MGEVQVAHDTGLHRAVAVKRMHANVAADPTLRGRFLDEAQITAQLDHPGIIPVHGIRVGEDQVRRGKAFVQGVVDRAGEDELTRLLRIEGSLPTPNEIDAPGLWIARVSGD